jgi:START domain
MTVAQRPNVNSSSSLAPDYFAEEARKAKELLLRAERSSYWEEHSSKHSVRLFSAKLENDKCKAAAFKGVCRIPAPLSEVFAFLKSSESRKILDASVEFTAILEQYVNTDKLRIELDFFSYEKIFSVSGREFLSAVIIERVSEDLAILASTAVEDERFPADKKRVRGKILLGGYVLRATGFNECEVTLINQIDIGGSIPSFLLTPFQKIKQAEMLSKLRKCVQNKF